MSSLLGEIRALLLWLCFAVFPVSTINSDRKKVQHVSRPYVVSNANQIALASGVSLGLRLSLKEAAKTSLPKHSLLTHLCCSPPLRLPIPKGTPYLQLFYSRFNAPVFSSPFLIEVALLSLAGFLRDGRRRVRRRYDRVPRSPRERHQRLPRALWLP
jgi:hypothetical protein